MNIPLSSPDITKWEIQAVNKVLKTPYLSLGPKLAEFEKRIANYLSVKYAIVVNSGTAALHLAMKSMNVTKQDEIITTPFSFVASANCALYVNATPRFIDICEDTFNIDPDKILEFVDDNCSLNDDGNIINKNTNKKIRIILPVHVFGTPCNMEALLKIAEQYKLEIIEDACEALGSEYNGKKIGSFGEVGVFAFYPNKQITTGEGGALVTNNPFTMKLCQSYRNQGRNVTSQWLVHERLGYNYRLSDINCALGIAQLDRIEEILTKREQVANLYNLKLKNIEEIRIPDIPLKGKKSWFVYVVQLSRDFSMTERNEIMNRLNHEGIACRNYFSPIHLQPFYREMFDHKRGDFPITESVAERTIALPFFNAMIEDQIDYIVSHLKKEIRRIMNKHRVILHELKTSCDLGIGLTELF